jgi:hypothetical protein
MHVQFNLVRQLTRFGWLAACLVGSGCAATDDSSSSDSGFGGGQAVGGSSSASQGGSVSGVGGASSATGGAGTSVGGASNSSAPTWPQLWTNYFQGACASCHSSSATVGSRLVFSNAAQLCTVLTTNRQLNGTMTPSLINANTSVLNWFSSNGSMPEGNNVAPANAVNDIKAWAAAGAVCP